MVGSRMKSMREFQIVGPATEKTRRPTAVSVDCWAGSEVLWDDATDCYESVKI